MKTSGLIRICTAIILSAPALLIASPASGQFYYALQKNFLPGDNDKKLTAHRNFYDEIKSVRKEKNNPFISVSLSSFENKVRRTDIYLKAAIIDSFEVNSINKSNDEDEEIRFRTTSFSYPANSMADIGISEYSSKLLIIYAKALKEYARKNGYDTGYAFLSNMGMLSNKKRFFVANLATMEIVQAGLVSNGRGQGATIYDKQYSDEAGSRCTSLGRYKILNKYRGNYGEAYRMAGLDSSNSNAYTRNIVLHSMSCIPDVENLAPACVTDGCPALSGKFLSSLRKIIDSRKKPMLLWVFDSNLEEPVLEEDHAKPNPVSAGFASTTKKSFSIRLNHANKRLHALVNKPTHQNKFFKWLANEKKRILKPLNKIKKAPGAKKIKLQVPFKKFFRQHTLKIRVIVKVKTKK